MSKSVYLRELELSESQSEILSSNVAVQSEIVAERVSDKVLNAVYSQNWTWKAARNGRYMTPVQAICKGTTIFSVFLSSCLTLARMPFLILFESYLATACLIVGLDAFNLVTRILAPQARALIASCIVGVMAAAPAKNNIFWLILTAFSMASIAAIRFLNVEWLNQYNYLCSEAVQRALIADEEGKGALAWQEHGQRETKTLLYELGFEFDDTVIQAYCKPVYVLGFYNGFKRTAKAKSRIEKAEHETEEKAKQLEAAERQLAEAKAELKQARKELRVEQEEHKQLEFNYNHVQKLYQEARKESQTLRKTNEQLIATNEELLLSIDQEDQTAEKTADQLTEQAGSATEHEENMIKSLLLAKDEKGNSLYSIRKIAEKVGCKRWKVEAIKKQIAAEQEDQDSNITVIGL